jgi:DNA polymerase-3 subunit alpha
VGEDGVGLLKFDFLGIKNLAILADAVKRVRRIRDIDVDIENVPIDDPITFAMLARGETMGLFQLNGTGMTAFLKQLKPSSIHDINAMVALYRPGPMESIPQYIERKHNPALVTYLDPRLKTILDRSYGVITYQDDVMTIARELAGYSWLEADTLRKAMGKKIPEVMAAEKNKLLQGFIEYGKIAPNLAEKLWTLIEPFAAYGFNMAHAASYGKVAYQTAYMKANYPVEYMSAVLTADSGDTEKISEIIHECERMGIEVLPPDINESFSDFTVVPISLNSPTKTVAAGGMQGGGEQRPEPYEVYGEVAAEPTTPQTELMQGSTGRIRFGLTTIKNFGEGIAESIISERKANGPYQSLADFLTRIHDRNLNKKSLEALIMTGALDRFAERGTMYANIELLLAFNKDTVARREAAQSSLFGGVDSSVNALTLTTAPYATTIQKLTWEKELLGVYVSGHPLDGYAQECAKRPSIRTVKDDKRPGIPVVTCGMVESVRELLTKKGERMAFVVLTDKTDAIEMVLFPSVYTEHRSTLTPGTCIAVKGRLSIRNDEVSIAADGIRTLQTYKQ